MRCVPALDDAWMMSANWNYSTMDESMTDQKFTDIETAGKTPGVSGLKPSSNTTLPVGAIAAGGLRQTDQWVAGSSKAMSPFVDTACPDFSDEAAKMISDSDQATDLPTSKCLPRLFAAMHEHVTAHNGQLHLIFVEIANLRQVCNMAEADVEERLLRAVADRIKSCLGPDDLVGHHHCDEFVILAPEERDQKGLHCLLDALRRIVRSPVAVEGIPYHLFLRIGVSTYPNDGETFGILLKRAGAASRYAAPFEPDVLNFYTEKFSADVRERMLLRADLHEAIGLEQMILHYQPQIDVMSGQTVGVEALVRWAHPTRGMIMPGQFIPVAEETGLIIAMGKWILYEACRQAVMWQRAYAPGLTMAVNLSVAQLRHAGVVEIVRGALRQSGLPAGLLKLELTESVFLEDAERVLRILEEFRSMGVKLSIDDFGVGYSSLAYLKRLSVDQLKIDQSFIRDLTVDATNSEIVKAIIGLGHSLRLSVVAEGVETPQQMNLLRRLGCHHVQGFLFSRPIPATALRSWID